MEHSSYETIVCNCIKWCNGGALCYMDLGTGVEHGYVSSLYWLNVENMGHWDNDPKLGTSMWTCHIQFSTKFVLIFFF
jgi:hypothetical protein